MSWGSRRIRQDTFGAFFLLIRLNSFGISVNSFGVFGNDFVQIKPKTDTISVCSIRILAHSLNRNKYFWRILGLRKKNEACAENKFALSTMPVDFK